MYSGQLPPRSCDTKAIVLMPLGQAPSQPRQVDVGNSQRPSRSGVSGLQSSKEGPTSGGISGSGSLHERPPSRDRSNNSSVGTNPRFTTLVNPSAGCSV